MPHEKALAAQWNPDHVIDNETITMALLATAVQNLINGALQSADFKISGITIDDDKDWNGKSITNVLNLGITGKLTVGGAIDPTEIDLPDDAPIYFDTAKEKSLKWDSASGSILSTGDLTINKASPLLKLDATSGGVAEIQLFDPMSGESHRIYMEAGMTLHIGNMGLTVDQSLWVTEETFLGWTQVRSMDVMGSMGVVDELYVSGAGHIRMGAKLADPISPREGTLWYRSDLDRLRLYDGVGIQEFVKRGGDTMTGDLTIQKATPTLKLYGDGSTNTQILIGDDNVGFSKIWTEAGGPTHITTGSPLFLDSGIVVLGGVRQLNFNVDEGLCLTGQGPHLIYAENDALTIRVDGDLSLLLESGGTAFLATGKDIGSSSAKWKDGYFAGDIYTTNIRGSGFIGTEIAPFNEISVTDVKASSLAELNAGEKITLVDDLLVDAGITVDGIDVGSHTHSGLAGMGPVLVDAAYPNAVLRDGSRTMIGDLTINKATAMLRLATDFTTYPKLSFYNSLQETEMSLSPISDVDIAISGNLVSPGDGDVNLGDGTHRFGNIFAAYNISVGGNVDGVDVGSHTHSGVGAMGPVLVKEAYPQALLLDGSRTMTGDLTIEKDSPLLEIKAPVSGTIPRIRLSRPEIGSMDIDLTVDGLEITGGNLYLDGDFTLAGTVDGVDVGSHTHLGGTGGPAVAGVRAGVAASRPASGETAGALYFATDTGVLSIWDGTAWKGVELS